MGVARGGGLTGPAPSGATITNLSNFYGRVRPQRDTRFTGGRREWSRSLGLLDPGRLENAAQDEQDAFGGLRYVEPCPTPSVRRDGIQIVAIAHERRRDQYWKLRLDG